MQKIIALIIACISLTNCYSQNISKNLIKEYEDTLEVLASGILNGNTEDKRYKANEGFRNTLKEVLSYKKSFKYEFNSLTSISKLYSEEKSFRIFNWFLRKDNKEYEYFCFIHYYNPSKKEYKIIELKDNSKNIRRPENKQLNKENWYGAYYYDIIYEKNKNRKYHILLGKDFNNEYSTKKIIDVISLSKGKVNLGIPIFYNKKEKKYRIIIEYNSKTSISLRYDKKNLQIIFDHLVPLKKELEGIQEYYVPDGTFDAYQYNGTKWTLQENIDIKSDIRIKPYKKPEMGLTPK